MGIIQTTKVCDILAVECLMGILQTTKVCDILAVKWLNGVRHMVKDHSDSDKGNPLPPHRLLYD